MTDLTQVNASEEDDTIDDHQDVLDAHWHFELADEDVQLCVAEL